MKSGLLVAVGLLVSSGGLFAADSLRVTKVATLSDSIDYAWAIAVNGDYAYLADHDDGMRLIDISNPAEPTPVGFYGNRWENHGIVVEGNRAYLESMSSGFHIIDVTDPTAPLRVSNTRASDGLGVAISGVTAFVVPEYGGLKIIDITNERRPRQLSELDLPGDGYAVTIAGNYAYIAQGEEGLYIVDISDPATPINVGRYAMGDYLMDVSISGDIAYLAYWQFGIRVLDISDPAEPLEIENYRLDTRLHGLTITNYYLFATSLSSGFHIMDISNPWVIRRVGYYNTPGSASDVAFLPDGFVIVADSSNVGVYDCSEALSVPPPLSLIPQPLSLQSYPNPFNSSTTISYSLPRPGRYALDVVDIQGRLVTRLADGWKEAGSYREVLNSNEIPSGVLILKLSGDRDSRLQRVQLIK